MSLRIPLCGMKQSMQITSSSQKWTPRNDVDIIKYETEKII